MDPISRIKEHLSLWWIGLFNLLLLWEYLNDPTVMLAIVIFFLIQSMIYGLGHLIKMGFLQPEQVVPWLMNGKLTPFTTTAKIGLMLFFCVHYYIFHFMYGIFLNFVDFPGEGIGRLHLLFPEIWIFIIGYFIALPSEIRWAKKMQWNLGTLMFSPYLRVVPVHLLIVLGAFVTKEKIPWVDPFLIFLILKIASDVGYHFITKHQIKRAALVHRTD